MRWLSTIALVALCGCGEVVTNDGTFTVAVDPPSVFDDAALDCRRLVGRQTGPQVAPQGHGFVRQNADSQVTAEGAARRARDRCSRGRSGGEFSVDGRGPAPAHGGAGRGVAAPAERLGRVAMHGLRRRVDVLA